MSEDGVSRTRSQDGTHKQKGIGVWIPIGQLIFTSSHYSMVSNPLDSAYIIPAGWWTDLQLVESIQYPWNLSNLNGLLNISERVEVWNEAFFSRNCAYDEKSRMGTPCNTTNVFFLNCRSHTNGPTVSEPPKNFVMTPRFGFLREAVGNSALCHRSTKMQTSAVSWSDKLLAALERFEKSWGNT